MGCNKCKYSWINSILTFFLKPYSCFFLLLFEWTWCGEMKHLSWHRLKIMDVFESQGSSWWYPGRDQDQVAFAILVESLECCFFLFLFYFFFLNHTIDFAFQTVRQMSNLPVCCTTFDIPCNITQNIILTFKCIPRESSLFLHWTSEDNDTENFSGCHGLESPMLRVFLYTFSLTGLTGFKD